MTGTDGRIYFQYNIGAELRFTPQSGVPFTYKITECDYSDGKEYYTIEVDGKELSKRYEAKEITLLLSFMPHDVIAYGVLTELPLTVDEVKEYYEAKAKALKAANTQANQELKDTDYFKLLKKRVNVARSLSIAQADESGEVEDLAAELKSVDDTIEKILTEKKIDKAVLRKVPSCAVCNDTGLVRGEICLCALSNSKAIKSFAAANRCKKEQ